MVEPAFIPRFQEAEVGRSLLSSRHVWFTKQVSGQPEQHSETTQNKTNKNSSTGEKRVQVGTKLKAQVNQEQRPAAIMAVSS